MKFLRSLNKLVPNDIYFKKIKKVDENFNARFNAVSKEYVYIINYKEYDLYWPIIIKESEEELKVEEVGVDLHHLHVVLLQRFNHLSSSRKQIWRQNRS